MKSPNDPDLDSEPDRVNDNNGTAIAPAPQTGALASAALAALVTAFKKVDVTPIGGRPIHPLLQFKSREGGVWAFGQRRTIPEPGSLWAVNPTTFAWSWVCWNDTSKILGERMVLVTEPLLDVTQLPNLGFEWQKQMGVNMKCVTGIDAGAEVVFKTNTRGGIGELSRLIDEVRDRLNGQHDGKVVPVVKLEHDSYPHQQYGKTFVPVVTIFDWMSLDGPAPASEPTPTPPPPPAEQPRRRRVG